MRIINKADYRLVADYGGLLIFRHRRYDNDYIACKECKIFDRKTGYARVLKAKSPELEKKDSVIPKSRLVCSASSC